MMPDIHILEEQLNEFNPQRRSAALDELLRQVGTGDVSCASQVDAFNLHCHTFFSFNAYGYSPTALAWLARQQGYSHLGMVDFDVLDGVDEFLSACDQAGVRGSAGIETRVYVPEFSSREINSPGEPGVYYDMGIGFTSSRVEGKAAAILADLRARAEQRNRAMVKRLNSALSPLQLDYDNDVLPLTPSGNATERHLLQAYLQAARQQTPDELNFWVQKTGLNREQLAAQAPGSPAFQNLLRGKLMKRGGPGYAQPEEGAFPRVEDFHAMIEACGAIPCFTWLDGTSTGEQAIEELLDLMVRKGAAAVNIIPDRNWNIADPQARALKVANLYRFVALAQAYHLPVNVGTEMNAFGQKKVDDFAAPELQPVRQAFRDGAHFIYGHTALQRGMGCGWQSAWAKTHLPQQRERAAFFTRAGQLIPPGKAGLARLTALPNNLDPAELLARLESMNR